MAVTSVSSFLTVVFLLQSMTLFNLMLSEEVNDIQSILRSWQPLTEETHGEADQNIMWGLPDAKATVGKVFSYTIPDHAFRDQVDSYKVRSVSAVILSLTTFSFYTLKFK